MKKFSNSNLPVPKSAVTKKAVLDATVADAHIATAIAQIAEAAQRLRETRLTDKCLMLLLSHFSGVSQRDCRLVLETAADLKRCLKK